MRDFVDAVRRPRDAAAGRPEVYRALGRGELREGRSLDALQAAYRLGARLAWRRLGRAAAAAGHPAEVQRTLAEAIFAYIDELAAESVEGYSAAKAERAGERDRRRRQLLGRLLEGAPAEELEQLADRADWPAPSVAAACAVEPDRLRPAVRRLAPETLADIVDGAGCLVLGDPDAPGRRGASGAVLTEHGAAVGPALPLTRLADSWRWALRLHRAGGLTDADRGTASVDEHLADLVLLGDRPLTRRLAGRALAPLDSETSASRRRLADTLEAWLQCHGNRAAAARRLGVHPQTVRYRIERLQDLFGAALEEPGDRLTLMVALRARGLLGDDEDPGSAGVSPRARPSAR